MIEDPDVIFVDFDELFDAKALDNAFGPSSGSQSSTDPTTNYSTESNYSKNMETEHGFGSYQSYAPPNNMPHNAMDHSKQNMGYSFPPPPPGYPIPFHAAYYYPHHHHAMHPGVFYPPGSLPHHHVNPMNPYPVPVVDPSLYHNPHNPHNLPPANNAQAVMSAASSDPKAAVKEEPLMSLSVSAKRASNGAMRKGSDPSAPSNTTPRSRARKELPSPPPPPQGDSPRDIRDDESIAGAKPMTREQFYKIRPKLPRISKSDPRRLYASAFGDAYNSCDFDKIWEFMSTYCTKDVLFVHRWVGSELYMNFPKYLEVRGIESVAEYWFSRCLVAPDLVLENKETKLYVRSDGISTVLSSFTIVCTRLYDGEISDSIICQPAVDSDLCSNVLEASCASEVDTLSSEEPSQKPDDICNRVFEKVDRILSRVEPLPKRRTKRKASEDSLDEDLFSFTTSSSNSSSDTLTSGAGLGTDTRKRMPKDQSITLLGTVTLHLNPDFKIRQIELNFALQQ